MDQQQLVKNGNTVHDLYFSIQEGGFGLSNTPNLIKRVVGEKMWQQFVVPKTGEVIEHKSFASFVTAHPPKGLGENLETIKRLCQDDNEALGLLTDAVGDGRSNGNNPRGIGGKANKTIDNVDIINVINSADKADRPTGTNKSAGLRRLRSEIAKAKDPGRRRELESAQALVLANEKSVHGALVELGIRQKTITIPLDPERAARAIRRNFESGDIEQLIELLQESPNA